MSATAEHKSLAEALAAFQGEEGLTFHKTKTAKVKSQRTGAEYTYKYADLGDILPVVRPLLAKHGLSWGAKPGRDLEGELVLRYRLLHASGEVDQDEMPLGVDKHCKPQELGSAITYARRYALTAQLNLATEEDDDGATAQDAPRRGGAQRKEPLAPRVTAEEIKALTAAAKGLPTTTIKLAFAACALTPPDPFVPEKAFDGVPRDKAQLLTEALAGAKR